MSEVTCTVPYCQKCGRLDTIQSVPDGDGGGQWVCANCGFRFGIWLDGGELDLGLVPPPDPDAPITFFEETWE